MIDTKTDVREQVSIEEGLQAAMEAYEEELRCRIEDKEMPTAIEVCMERHPDLGREECERMVREEFEHYVAERLRDFEADYLGAGDER